MLATFHRPETWALIALAVLTLIRLCVGAVTPLAPDEAYYWVWSRALAPGYVDHPPMVALWIWAGTSLIGSNPLAVRLLGPVSAALGSLLLYDAVERLFPGRRAGLTAAALLNATLALGVGAVIMTPDTPLLLFWTATFWAGARLAAGGGASWWLAAGVFSGLAMISKYTGAFLPLGLGLFVLAAMPRALRRVEFWLGGLISGLVFLPVVIWNAENHWAGFLRQGGRVGDWHPGRAVGFLAELVFGQIGLATPGVSMLFAAGIVMAVRCWREPRFMLLAALSVPPALVFLQHAVGDRVQGNWPAILYPAAAVAASALTWAGWRRAVWPSVGLGFAIAFVVYAHAVSGWPALAGDPVARQLLGWDDLAARIQEVRRERGAMDVAAEPYGLASELAWTLPAGAEVLGAGAHWASFALPEGDLGERLVLLVRPERYNTEPDPEIWRDAVGLAGMARTSAGVEVERYSLFLAHAVEGPFSGASLPHR